MEEQSQVLHESQSLMLFSDEELRTLMYGAIEKVVVYGNEEIEIQWKFHTPFQKGRGLIREAK